MANDTANYMGTGRRKEAVARVRLVPGTGKVKHLEDNAAAAGIELSDEDFATLDKIGRR